jgi:antitoxin (DNA-binding transcriptional repressor) of toxin-antitoxin stability system
MSGITTIQIQQDPLDFLRRVEAGESMLIVSATRPLAEIRPVASAVVSERPFGHCAGEFTVPDDFDDPLPEEILRELEGQ